MKVIKMEDHIKEEYNVYISGGWTTHSSNYKEVVLCKSGTTIGGHLFILCTVGIITLGLMNYIYEKVNMNYKTFDKKYK